MNYIAYTIGPIYETILETLQGDNKTKRLQAGSKFFSHFMQELLKNIYKDFEVLVPYVNGDILDKKYEMGLFHDRFIACSESSKIEIKELFSKKLEKTFLTLAEEIESESVAKELYANMDNHLIVASQEELKSLDENTIFAINKILDAQELQRSFSFDIQENYIRRYQDKHIKNSKVKTIEALSKELGFDYYAVITADGDKMGTKIKNEATEDILKIKDISKKLFEFFVQKDDIYTLSNVDFGGELIYAGGDDILALIPVKNGDVTFLDYISRLDERFKKIVGEDVSLSFGVNVAYYKYPLRDAIKSSFDLLYRAKNTQQNSVALKITKHSGQTFESVMQLNTSKYKLYKKLVDGVLEEKIKLPHSIHHSLKRYQQAIIGVFQNEYSSLEAMFGTVFNDDKDEATKEGMKLLKEYIESVEPQNNDEFDALFSQLSLVKFLRGDRT